MHRRNRAGVLLDELEEVIRERHLLDDDLVAPVVPVARDELRRPRVRERPAPQRRAVAVLRRDVEVALVVRIDEAEAPRRATERRDKPIVR